MNNEAQELIKQLRAMRLQLKEIVNRLERLIRHTRKSCSLCYTVSSGVCGISRISSSDCPSLRVCRSYSLMSVTQTPQKIVAHSASWKKEKLGQATEFPQFKLLWAHISDNDSLEHKHELRQRQGAIYEHATKTESALTGFFFFFFCKNSKNTKPPALVTHNICPQASVPWASVPWAFVPRLSFLI